MAAAAVFLAICLSAALAGGSQPIGSPPWYGILPPLLAVMLALMTNRIFLSLGTAVLAAGLLSVAADPFFSPGGLLRVTGGQFVIDAVWSLDDSSWKWDNLRILAYVVLVMAMISVMLAGGGLQGLASWLMGFARSVRSTKLVTVAAGLVIFIDDYANTMIVGSTLRSATDRQRISREKLAFLVDATAAPVAGIAVISTWIGMEVLLLSDLAVEHGVTKDGYAMFFDALGFRFYCILMIAFVILNAFSGADFGPMARAERRARTRGKLIDDDARPMTARSLSAAGPHPQARIRAATAVLPMAALLVVFVGLLWIGGGGEFKLAADPRAIVRLSVWREVLSFADSIRLLVVASAAGLLLAAALAVIIGRIPLSALARAVYTGAKGSLLPSAVLVMAWSLKAVCTQLQTGEFLSAAFADSLSPRLFPVLVFVVAAVTSFATGTSWGTMAILIPTAIPVALKLDGGYGPVTMISIAAVLDGAIFGDHCSPISDTTIMSSVASACDHLAHVRTQIPYSLLVAGVALCIGYLPAACGASCWFGILGGVCLLGLLPLGLRAFSRGRAAEDFD